MHGTDMQWFGRPTTWAFDRDCPTPHGLDHWGTWLPAPYHCVQSECATTWHCVISTTAQLQL